MVCERFGKAQTSGLNNGTETIVFSTIPSNFFKYFAITLYYIALSMSNTLFVVASCEIYRNPYTIPVEDVFHHFTLPTSLANLYLASPAETLPCTPQSTPMQFHFIRLYGQGSTQGRNRSPRTAGAAFIEVYIQHSAPHPSIRKRKGKCYTTNKAKKSTHNTKLTYLSVNVKSLICQNAGEGHMSWCIFSTVDS